MAIPSFHPTSGNPAASNRLAVSKLTTLFIVLRFFRELIACGWRCWRKSRWRRWFMRPIAKRPYVERYHDQYDNYCDVLDVHSCQRGFLPSLNASTASSKVLSCVGDNVAQSDRSFTLPWRGRSRLASPFWDGNKTAFSPSRWAAAKLGSFFTRNNPSMSCKFRTGKNLQPNKPCPT